MSTPLEPFYQLRCGCNSYPWGQPGKKSLAGRLCAQTPGFSGDDDPSKPFSLKDDAPYAEMWMGTYPSLPSYVHATSEALQDVLDRHPKELLGEAVVKRFTSGVDAQGLEPDKKKGTVRLPFLPKILSIAAALPLQIHPDKEAAARLHARDPESFADPNHKPEIAVALSDFEAFCGFKPLASVAALLNHPALRHVLSSAVRSSASGTFNNEDLRSVVRYLLEADAPTIAATYDAIASLPSDALAGDPNNAPIPSLLPRIKDQAHTRDDPAPLVALLTMNYLRLSPGEALYIPADGLHAYLSGDIVECMASSDNTISSGFCPPSDRFSAADFCDLLTFKPHSPDQALLQPMAYWRSEKGHTQVYQPPLSEFNVLATKLGAGEEEVLGKGGPSIVIATQGSATVSLAGKSFELGEGHVYFVAQGNKVEIKAGGDGLHMYTAYVE